MSINIGIDIGSVSLKLAAIGQPQDAALLRRLASEARSFHEMDGLAEGLGGPAVISEYRRILGSPIQATFDLLKEFHEVVPETVVEGIRVTGSGSRLIARLLGIYFENEFKAIARATSVLFPEVRTIFEMGGETSKYMRLDPVQGAQRLGIVDYSASGECAAGTGSFLDQQATRMEYEVEQIGEVACSTGCAARIAGRCSVFAKSDMVDAQQKGYTPPEILKGLCEAVARNFKSSVVKGKTITPPVAFIGAVSQNRAVVEAMREVFRLDQTELFSPPLHAWFGAIGSALLEWQDRRKRSFKSIHNLQQHTFEKKAQGAEPLSLENVVLLRDRVKPYRLPESGKVDAYLGIDIGSVSTNLALTDEAGELIHGIYLRTVGKPIEVVSAGLRELEGLYAGRVNILGVGTTGSGRELIGELVGADTVNDEITAHKTGAMHVCEQLVVWNQEAGLADSQPGPNGLVPEMVDTIFEIGGQDSKFIAIENGVVVDFAMNEACAAGTGSFLEEQAEKLGISIKDEFARLALESSDPTRLGERCTVFMERDVTAFLHRGADKRDLVGGLAYSIVLNYLNRVVRGRRIGNVIYFQGGTAYNDAVAAAFSKVLGKRIIVPPHNGVIGAIGMALIARERHLALKTPSRFRGYSLERTSFKTREFVCKACANYCDMKEITVGGEKTYWGDKCSDKFRKRARTDRKPVIEDLLLFRERVLLEGYRGPQGGRPSVGIPRAMFFYDRFPFWWRYLDELGFDVVISGATDRRIAAQGLELTVAQPCYPIQLAHGHVEALLERGVDYVLVPNNINEEMPGLARDEITHLCPWNQTLPWVLAAAPAFHPLRPRFLVPTVHLQYGREHVKKELGNYFSSKLGVSRKQSDRAVDSAYTAQADFAERVAAAGREALEILGRSAEPAVVLVGRAYNIYDRSVNCDIPLKLRNTYGVNVVPQDFLPLADQDVSATHPNMYWTSGRKILAAGHVVRRHRPFHVIYITNFKCGPDSFIKYYMRGAAGSPYLTLQFDGHGNDAGYMTRCEAYLDSKGILRCYAQPKSANA
jgi:predicted CoA-substrate-specific enzyme activase